MNKDVGTYELIQLYLSGRLSGSRLVDFEKRLSSDQDFKSYFENHQTANRLIKQKELLSIKNDLKKIHRESLHSGGSWKLILGVALSLMVIFFIWKYTLSESMETTKNISNVNGKNLVKKLDGINSDLSTVNKSSNDKIRNDEIQNSVIEIPTKDEDDNLVRSFDEKDLRDKNAVSILTPKSISNETLKGSEKPKELVPVVKREGDKTNNSFNPKEIDCQRYSVTLDIETHPSCEVKSNGFIEVKNDDFSLNYQFVLDEELPQKEKLFSNVKAGQHDLFVVDENNCKSDPLSVNVSEISCEIIIYPSQEKYWDIPKEISQNKNVNLEIYDMKSGQLVFEKELLQHEENQWNGRSLNGQILPMGAYLYSYVLNGHKFTGNITIVQ